MAELLFTRGDDQLARIFVLRTSHGAVVECVDARQPPLPLEAKWVLVLSTLDGCPVRCAICDAGGAYRGKLSAESLWEQLEFLVRRRFPEEIGVRTLKIQFARMGEPSFNPAVLEVLGGLRQRLPGPRLLPSLSTVAPWGTEPFFEELLAIKDQHFPGGDFQMQFSLHATDERTRQRVVPVRCWTYPMISRWGERFRRPGDRKITLNFALTGEVPLAPRHLADVFSPEHFLVKLTPLNPTRAAKEAGLTSALPTHDRHPARADEWAERFRQAGFETLIAIGEPEENLIGSNCGMYVSRALAGGAPRPSSPPAGR